MDKKTRGELLDALEKVDMEVNFAEHGALSLAEDVAYMSRYGVDVPWESMTDNGLLDLAHSYFDEYKIEDIQNELYDKGESIAQLYRVLRMAEIHIESHKMLEEKE